MEKTIATREFRIFIRLLKSQRKKSGLSQVQMAERLDETQSFISRCERGERRLDFVEVWAFCRAMGVPFGGFVEDFERAVERRKKR